MADQAISREARDRSDLSEAGRDTARDPQGELTSAREQKMPTSGAARPLRRTGTRVLRAARKASLPVLGLCIAAAVWEFVARVIIHDHLLLPTVESTASALWGLLSSGKILPDMAVSAEEFIFGYAIAAAGGLLIGAAFASWPTLGRMFMPLAQAAYITPLLAVAPLIITIVGVGISSKIVMVVILAIFPIIVNTETGLRGVDPGYLETARSFRASRFQELVKVVMPASAQSVVAGLRLGVAGGIAGVVIGEFFGAYSGLGFEVVQYSNELKTSDTMAVVVILAVVGLLLNSVLRRIENAVSPWRSRSGSQTSSDAH